MKVIKRDGRAVDYDRQKIVIAISKANKEVIQEKRATDDEIMKIIEDIELLGKKRMLVEDIQDIIEQKLMEIGKFDLAKKYIVYRYTRALVRKQNTTDESILGIIRKENTGVMKNIDADSNYLAATQRSYIAGEVSRDLTKRLLLPDKITKEEQEGVLHFHNADYFIQPIINHCTVNLKDMLENGTQINDHKIETPSNFIEACQILTQVILAVGSNQYGYQNIDISCLGKYLRKTYKNILKQNIPNDILESLVDKELEDGIRFLNSYLNTIITTNGRLPKVNFVLDLLKDDEYILENSKIYKKIESEKLVNGNNITLNDKKIIDIGMKYKFDQGKVSINLAQIAITSNGDEKNFWNELGERLDKCREALMYKHYALLGTVADISPIMWKYGAIARLQEGEKIDSLLNNKSTTLSLGYAGIYEAAMMFTKQTDIDSKENQEIITKIKSEINKKLEEYSLETGISFILVEEINQKLYESFLKIDKLKYGTIKNITDKESYIYKEES